VTLLRQIQTELASSDVDVVVVLRKCKILARRLHSAEFEQWVDWELNGYPADAEVPEYRTVHPVHYANFSNGYHSVEHHPISTLIIDENWRHLFDPYRYRAGIESIKTLAATDGGGMLHRDDFIFLLKNKVVTLPCTRFWSQISEVELKQIISAVISRLLDFTMDIEAENPNAGDAPLNEVPVPPERVQQLVNNYFQGPVGNVAQNSRDFAQTAQLGLTAADLTRFVIEFRTHMADLRLSPEDANRVNAQLETIEAQVGGEPNPIIVREAGRTIRNITEGAIGSLLATATQPHVWIWLHSILASLR
jgi:hypothetical protein